MYIQNTHVYKQNITSPTSGHIENRCLFCNLINFRLTMSFSWSTTSILVYSSFCSISINPSNSILPEQMNTRKCPQMCSVTPIKRTQKSLITPQKQTQQCAIALHLLHLQIISELISPQLLTVLRRPTVQHLSTHLGWNNTEPRDRTQSMHFKPSLPAEQDYSCLPTSSPYKTV